MFVSAEAVPAKPVHVYQASSFPGYYSVLVVLAAQASSEEPSGWLWVRAWPRRRSWDHSQKASTLEGPVVAWTKLHGIRYKYGTSGILASVLKVTSPLGP